MGTIDTLLRVKADAAQAVRGLAPLQASLQQTAADAEVTEKALNDLDGTHNIRLNDAAILRAREEISRLRQQMREQLAVDVNANTTAAQRRITQLQRSIRTLDAEVVDIPVVVETGQAETKLAAMRSSVSGIGSSMKGLVAITAGTAVGKFLVDGAKGAAAFEVNMRGVNAVLGDTIAIDISSWIQENAAGLNLSQEAASELARSLAITADRYQDAGGDATKFLESLENITAQAAAFSGADPGRVAEAIGAAFRGEFDSLEQFGINLSAAKIQAQAMADGLLHAGETMTPAIQTQATYNAILKDSAPLMGSVDRNADTLTGTMNNLNQSMSDLSASLGKSLGPTLAGVAEDAAKIADDLGVIINKYNELRAIGEKGKEDEKNDWHDLVDFATGSMRNMFSVWNNARENAFGGDNEDMKDTGKAIEDTGKKAAGASTPLGRLADEIAGLAEEERAAADAAEDHDISMKHLTDRVQSTAQAYEDLLANFTATNNLMISARSSVYNYEGAIDSLAESLKKNGATFSPDSEEGRKNWDQLVNFANQASTRITEALKHRGADAANSIFTSTRDTLHQMLADAGVESSKAWTLVDQVLKPPHTMKIQLDKANLKRIDQDLEKLRKKKRKIDQEFAITSPISPDAAERLGQQKELKLKPIQAQINVDLKDKDKTNEELAGISEPRGKPRKAQIYADVPQSSIDAANADLDNIIKLRRTAEIQVHIIPPEIPLLGEVPLGAAPRPGRRGAPPTAAGSPAPASPGVAERRAPRQTPVKVYLDGEEIADRLELRRRRLAGQGGRRNP